MLILYILIPQDSFNTASVAIQAFYYNTTGKLNTAIGYKSFLSNTTGARNAVRVHYTLGLNTTGYNNTASGHEVFIFRIPQDLIIQLQWYQKSLYDNTDRRF